MGSNEQTNEQGIMATNLSDFALCNPSAHNVTRCVVENAGCISIKEKREHRIKGVDFSVTVKVSAGEQAPRVVIDVKGHPEFAGLWAVYDGSEPWYANAIESRLDRGMLPPDLTNDEYQAMLSAIDIAVAEYEHKHPILKAGQQLEVEVHFFPPFVWED